MENLLNLTSRFQGYKNLKLMMDFIKYGIICTSNQTLMNSPEAKNIDRSIRFFIRTVLGRYESYRNEV